MRPVLRRKLQALVSSWLPVVLMALILIILCQCDRDDRQDAVRDGISPATAAGGAGTSIAAPAAQQPLSVQAFQITDHSGHKTDLYSPDVDYTVYSLTYKPDHSQSGVRVRQGEAVVSVQWDKIEELTFDRPVNDRFSSNLKGLLKLKGSGASPAEFKSFSRISGWTELGRFFIASSDVASIIPKMVGRPVGTLVDPNSAFARQSRTGGHEMLAEHLPSSLLVVDLQGHITALMKPRIDYTSYGFFYQRDDEHAGLRVRHEGASGVLTLPWTGIVSAELFSPGEKDRSPLWLIEVSGQKPQRFNIVPSSKDGLHGQTNLGDFSLSLSRVVALLPVYATATESKQRERAANIAAGATARLVAEQRKSAVSSKPARPTTGMDIPIVTTRPAATSVKPKVQPPSEWRVWTTADGKYRTEAKFLRSINGVVTLEKRDGTTVDVQLNILSASDQAEIRRSQ